MKVVRVFHAGRVDAQRERERAMTRAGVDVTLVVPSVWPEADELSTEPFEIVEIPVTRAGDINRHRYDADAIAAVVRRVRPDVVDLHAEPYSSTVHHLHSVLPPDQTVVGYTAQNIDKRFPPPFGRWERQTLTRWTGLYACSRQAAAVVAGKGFRGALSVIPYAAPPAFRPRTGTSGERFRMLLAGRLEPYKGVADAVRLLGRLDDAELHLIGTGPEADTARRLARLLGVEDQLTVSEWMSAADLARAFQRADVVLAPSRSTSSWVEQFGRMVVEAHATGAVVVGYASGALPEVVGSAGILVPEGDEDALHAAVADLQRHPDRLLELRDKGYAAIRTWDDVAAAQIDLYEQALATTRRGGVARSRRTAAHAEWGKPADTAWALPRRTSNSTAPRPLAGALRVVFLDHVARMSGGEIAMVRLIRALPEVTSHVILAEDGPLRQALEDAGATVEILPMTESTRGMRRSEVGSLGRSLIGGVATAAYAVQLAARLRQLRPDVVHANSLKSGYYGGVAARMSCIPLVWHVRDRIAADYMPARAAALTRRAIRTLSDGVITNSRATLDTLGGFPRATSILTVADPYAAPSTAPVGARDAEPDGLPTVGMVGRLASWKGQDVFIDAVAQVRRTHEVRARIIGAAMFDETQIERDLSRKVESLGLNDVVTFTGFSADIPRELSRMDVLVHASIVPEPFGQVIVEGLAAGVPVITARGGGASEIVSHEETALITTPGDAEELARAIVRLLDDPALRGRLAASGIDRARDFTPEKIAPRVRAFYEAVRR